MAVPILLTIDPTTGVRALRWAMAAHRRSRKQLGQASSQRRP